MLSTIINSLRGGASPAAKPGDSDLSVTIGGSEISGWEDVEVTLRAEGFPNSFRVSASSRTPISDIAKPGAECSIKLGSDKVMTGYLDRYNEAMGGDQHIVQLAGRGKTQDLVDCSGEWPTGQYSGGTVLTIANILAKPYGITVRLADGTSAGPEVQQWCLNYGETAASLIQRFARNAGLLAYEDADGVLVLATAGTKVAASGIVHGENIQDWRAEHAMDGRYSEIVCCAMASPVLGDIPGSDFFYSAPDPEVPRHRIKYLVVEPVAAEPQKFLESKARWEAARNAGRSVQVSATVDGWRDKSGKLWTPNTLVPVQIPASRAGSPLCLGEVTFRRSSATGTTATLNLMPPTAFTPEPLVVNTLNAADLTLPDAR